MPAFFTSHHQDKATHLPFKFVHLGGKAWGMGAFLPPLNSFILENWSAFSPFPGFHGAPGGAPSGTLSFFLDPPYPKRGKGSSAVAYCVGSVVPGASDLSKG